MMLQNSAPLAAEEQALSNSISQLAASVYQDIQALGGLDVAVQATVVQGLTAKVQDQLRKYKSLLSDLQHAAEEQETPEQTQRVANVLARHQTDYDSIHKAFQTARISYTRRKEQSYVQQRQELIGSVDFSQRQQQIASEQEAEHRAQDVTASLRRTRQLMAQNLEQTHGNISVIASGNKRLHEAGDELSGQKDMFKESHGLLSTLKTQSLLDRFAMWGGFAFFMLVVLYISFKRTPAFMKQPLYALLHMKHGGKPFDHHDYASVNIPPGTFTPSDKPWAVDEAFGGQAYPSEWATWDGHFEGLEHGQDVAGNAPWNAQDLLSEGLQPDSADAWQQRHDGTLRDRLRAQQQQQQAPPGEQQPWQQQQQHHVEDPGTPMQQHEQPVHEQCAAGDAACFAAAGRRQQQPHEDADEIAFHSDDQQQRDQDHDEVEYQQQQQQQLREQEQQDHQQPPQQDKTAQQQQELEILQQQEEQQRLAAEQAVHAARESAAAHVAAETAAMKAALRRQPATPMDTSNAAAEGSPGPEPVDQTAAAAPAAEPAAEAAMVGEPPAAAQEQLHATPAAVERPIAAEPVQPVPERPAVREQATPEVPLAPEAQQAEGLMQQQSVATAPAPPADLQAAAAMETPIPGHEGVHAAPDQHPAAAEHVVADADHVLQQQHPDMVQHPGEPESVAGQERQLSVDTTVQEHEEHAGQPAATGATEPAAAAAPEQQSATAAAAGQPSGSEAPTGRQLQADGTSDQEIPQVHAVEQQVEQPAAEPTAASPPDAVLEAPGTPAVAAAVEQAHEQQRQLQGDQQQQEPAQSPAAAEALSQEHLQEQQFAPAGEAVQAGAVHEAPAAGGGDVIHEPQQQQQQPIEPPEVEVEVVQLDGPQLQQLQQIHEPVTAAPTPAAALEASQRQDQHNEAAAPVLAPVDTHAEPVGPHTPGLTAPEVAAPVDVTGEAVPAALHHQQQQVDEPQQHYSTFDSDAELVHQPPVPPVLEAAAVSGTELGESVVSPEATKQHQQQQQEEEEVAAAQLVKGDVAPAGAGDAVPIQPDSLSERQHDISLPQEEQPADPEQAHQQQQISGQAAHPEPVGQSVHVDTVDHPSQRQQQEEEASGLLQDVPAQVSIADQVPDHQQHQALHPPLREEPAGSPLPTSTTAAQQTEATAPVVGAAESAQRTAATISTAAEDVVGAAVEAATVAEQVKMAIGDVGRSFGAKVLSRWGGHSGLAARGGARAVRQQQAAARTGGGSSFFPAAAAAEVPAPMGPLEGSASYTGADLDHYADETFTEQQAGEVQSAAAPAIGSMDDSELPNTINPDSLSAAELDKLSKQIEEEQQRAFTITDMDDVGLYHYEGQGNAVLRNVAGTGGRQGGEPGISSGSAATAPKYAEL